MRESEMSSNDDTYNEVFRDYTQLAHSHPERLMRNKHNNNDGKYMRLFLKYTTLQTWKRLSQSSNLMTDLKLALCHVSLYTLAAQKWLKHWV